MILYTEAPVSKDLARLTFVSESGGHRTNGSRCCIASKDRSQSIITSQIWSDHFVCFNPLIPQNVSFYICLGASAVDYDGQMNNYTSW